MTINSIKQSFQLFFFLHFSKKPKKQPQNHQTEPTSQVFEASKKKQQQHFQVIHRPLITLCSCDMRNNQFTARNRDCKPHWPRRAASTPPGHYFPHSNSLGHNPATRANITDPLTSLQGKSVNIKFLGFRKASILLLPVFSWTKYPAYSQRNTELNG